MKPKPPLRGVLPLRGIPLTKRDEKSGNNHERVYPTKKVESALEGLKQDIIFSEGETKVDIQFVLNRIDKWFPAFVKKEDDDNET